MAAIVVLDDAGAHLASWTLDPSLQVFHIAGRPDGSVVVVGAYAYAEPTVAGRALPRTGSSRVTFVATYQPDGTPIDAFAITAPMSPVSPTALAATADGDVVLGTTQVFLEKRGIDGTVRWTHPEEDGAGGRAEAIELSTSPTGEILAVASLTGGYGFGMGPGTATRDLVLFAPDGSASRQRGIEALVRTARVASATRWVAAGEFYGTFAVGTTALRAPPPSYTPATLLVDFTP